MAGTLPATMAPNAAAMVTPRRSLKGLRMDRLEIELGRTVP
jgi:hypothetical protein